MRSIAPLFEDTVQRPRHDDKLVFRLTKDLGSVIARRELEVVIPHCVSNHQADQGQGQSLANAVIPA